jgi:hypothetical protein
MPPTISARVFLAEFVLIVIPYGLAAIAGIAMLWMFTIASRFEPEALLMLVGGIALVAPYAAGVVLSVAYLRGGTVRLGRVRPLIWAIASVGAALAALAVCGTVIGYRIPWPFAPWSPAENPFGLAPRTVGAAFARGLVIAPLLVPFGHLFWAQRKAFSNPSLERP